MNIHAQREDRLFTISDFKVTDAQFVTQEVARWKELLTAQRYSTATTVSTNDFITLLQEDSLLVYTDGQVDGIMGQLILDGIIEAS